MNESQKVPEQRATIKLAASPHSEPLAPPDQPKVAVKRKAVARHRAAAEAQASSLQALAGNCTADTVEFERRYREILGRALDEVQTLGDLQQLDKSVARWVDVVRQEERLMRLEHDLAQPPAASSKRDQSASG